PVADIRCGILTMRERWEALLNQSTGTLTETYLQPVFPFIAGDDNLFINGSVFATRALKEEILNLQEGEKLMDDDFLIACRFSGSEVHSGNFEDLCRNLHTKNAVQKT